MEPISETARKAAEVILNYVTTRFPAGHDAPSHAIDEEWFAQAVQTALSDDRFEYRRQLAAAERDQADDLRKRLEGAGDRRDWAECDRLEGLS